MAAPGVSAAAAVLDPSTLPQVAFARADDLLTHAAQFRTKAEILKERVKEHEARAEQFEECAAELQASAEEDRDHVQAELDTTLEYHGDVLEHFLLTPENEKDLRRLTTSVEEGRAYVHEVVALGEKLLQVKAAKLQSSQQVRSTSLPDASETEGGALGSQIPFQILTPFRALSSSTSTAAWQDRFHRLWERRVPNMDHTAYASLTQTKTGQGSADTHKEIEGSFDKVETRDGQEPETRNEAHSSRSDTQVESTSTEVLQNVVLPVLGRSVSVEAGSSVRRSGRKETALTESHGISSQEIVQSHMDEDSVPLEPSETPAPANKFKRGTPGSEITVPDTKRRKEAPKPTEKEKGAAYDGEKTFAKYRRLIDNGTGPDRVKEILKLEIGEKIKNSSQISQKRKERLFEYGHNKINALINKETKRGETRRENERRAEAKIQNGRKGRKSKPTGKAMVLQKSEPELTEEEKAAIFNEPEALARYCELFSKFRGTDQQKEREAKKSIKWEIVNRICSQNQIPFAIQKKLVVFVRQQVNAMVRRETEVRDEAKLKQQTEDGESAQPEDLYIAGSVDERADDALETSSSEHRQYVQLEDLYAAELSDESADEAMWP